MALEPYTSSAGWYGIEVSFKRCAKRNGGVIKKGSVWGRLVYSDMMTGQNISREDAIKLALMPKAIRWARYTLLNKKLCAVCGKEGLDEHHKWGWLRYLDHEMDICPSCVKEIYDKSYQPWRNN